MRNSRLSESESCFSKMSLPRRSQLFTADEVASMLDADTHDLDRNGSDIEVQVILVVDSETQCICER